MIITESQYLEYFSSDKVKRYPIISNKANYLCLSDIFEFATKHFLYVYNTTLEKFIIDKQLSRRAKQVSSLSVQEFLYLKNICKYDDPADALDLTLQIKNIRVFLISKEIEDSGYHIIEFGGKDIDKNNINIISIFIGSNFAREDDMDNLRLVYDLAEIIIDQYLYNAGVDFNIISNTYVRKTIVLSPYIDPSDATFVTDYYSTLFRCIYNVTNRSIIHNFESVYENTRPILPILSHDDMQVIWKFSCSVNYDNIDLYCETCSYVYEKLLNMQKD